MKVLVIVCILTLPEIIMGPFVDGPWHDHETNQLVNSTFRPKRQWTK